MSQVGSERTEGSRVMLTADDNSPWPVLVVSIKVLEVLTEHSHQGGGGRPLSSHVGRHAAVVGCVAQLGLQDQQAAGAAHDEVGLGAGVDGDAVPEPGNNPGAGSSSGRMTAELSLFSHLDVGVVGRSLKIFT